MAYNYCPHYPDETSVLRHMDTKLEHGQIAEIDCHACGVTYIKDSGDGMDSEIALSFFKKGVPNPEDPNGLQWVLKESE